MLAITVTAPLMAEDAASGDRKLDAAEPSAKIGDRRLNKNDLGITQWVQPAMFIGYNRALGVEGEVAGYFGNRNAGGTLYGVGPVVGYSKAGWKVGLGVGVGEFTLGGGGGSIGIRAVRILTKSDGPYIDKDQDYNGFEIACGIVGAGGGYAAKIGYYWATDTDDSTFVIGVGIGM